MRTIQVQDPALQARLQQLKEGDLVDFTITRAVAAAIRKYGFRRWYSRQLVEGHAHLITGFLALIMMAIAVEEIEFRHTFAGWLSLGAVAAVGGGLCLVAWRQFNRVLFRAEHLAERATCAR